ncbi:phage terminase large subunit family protein [Labrenzia sp. R4_2]|uniref:phage terminase large subunit family protein n=1 Tax=Labrenzia sp. R4_2 TaxID=2821107 RepID=UPI001AD96308|nr:phage terminase large subunit family protein [Labrenzia sp. R4_2]MBO9422334.1 phage terminase large subunit family protein [Labrenzia sp. R4_2]
MTEFACIKSVRRTALASLLPPPNLKLSEWIEANVRLPSDVSSVPGPVQLWPFQKAIADAIGDPGIERVTLVKPVRVGFSTLLTGALASYVANDPSPILSLLPTEADCRDYVVSDIEPIFSASPELAGLLVADSDPNSRSTLLSRKFPGGSLKVVAAKAPRNLRRHNVRILFVDEADGMESSAEGSPVLLAEKRTLSFPNRKIIMGSTPVLEDTSHVLRAYAQSDQRVFEVPCPECGDFHEITWKDIHWPEGGPDGAHYVCPSCGSVVEEKHKRQMVNAGRWRATKPEITGHAGFRMNALISPLAKASWAALAKEFLAAKNDPEGLQVFVNTILGQGWRMEGQELDEAALAGRAKPFSLVSVPEDVLVITVGVDVQHDRLELTYVGWNRDGHAYVLGHAVIWGLPDNSDTWAELDSLLKARFAHPLGGKIGIEAAAVDSSDGQTMEDVYRFCFPRSNRRILAIKGVRGDRPWIEKSKSGIKRGGWLWIVGVDSIKAHLTTRLTQGSTIHFSDTLDPVWFEQLASERSVLRYNRGQPQRRFERIPGRDAEALDCVVYAFAARQIVNVNWDERLAAVCGRIQLAHVDEKNIIRSSWLK